MNTVVLKNFDLSLAIDCLKRGEPVAFPTETVYGLGAPIFNEAAIRRVFEIKGRPLDNPLIAHIALLDDARRLAVGLGDPFYTLASLFWPGPLTIVLKRRPEVPSCASAGKPSIAIRMPLHTTARRLIEGVGEPLVAPSANLSGRPSPTRIGDVLEDLNGKIEYAIDGGECEVGIESTVISLFHRVPTLLRPGIITKETLEDVLKQKIQAPSSSVESPLSPGMKYRHYAPKAKVKLVFRKEELKEPYFKPTAKNLYAELRQADRKGLLEIQVYCDDEVQKNEALMNRLLQSSGRSDLI